MAVEERGARKGIYVLGIIILFLVVFFVSSANAADTIYGPNQYPDYNGSTDGYMMMYDGSSQTTYLRGALSVRRDAYHIGKTVSVYIRTDGYYSQDCGWWYTNGSVNIDFLNITYPNGSMDVLQLTNLQTDERGIYKNGTFFKVATNQPMGIYKVSAKLSSGGTTLGEQSPFAVYFDVGGELNLSVESYTPEVNVTSPADDANITVDIFQPNGDHFDSLVDGSDGSVTIHAGIILPNESYWERSNTTTTGHATISFPVTEVGRYFVVLSANGSVGNSSVTGRTECNVVGLGEWPTSASFYNEIITRVVLMAIIGTIFAYPAIRNRRGLIK